MTVQKRCTNCCGFYNCYVHGDISDSHSCADWGPKDSQSEADKKYKKHFGKTIKTIKGDKKTMAKNLLKDMLAENKKALADTAKIKSSEILIANAKKIISKYLPDTYKDVLEMKGNELIIANLSVLFIKLFADDMKHSPEVINALLISAQIKMLEGFDPEKIYKDLTKGVKLSKK